jgi:hypothetical protein
MSLLLRYYMALAVADESGLSRDCAEAAGLPPATLKHEEGKHDKSVVSERFNSLNPCMMMMMMNK